MGKCLITKLNGVVSDTSILKLGEVRLVVKKVDIPSKDINKISLVYSSNETVSILGDGNFTNDSLVEDKGKTANLNANELINLFFSNVDCELSLPNKYNLLKVSVFNPNSYFDLDSVKYSKNLNTLFFTNAKNVTGNISSLKDLHSITYLGLQNSSITGNISNLKDLIGMTNIYINDTLISGDLSSLSNMSNLKILSIKNSLISGDLSSLKNLSQLSGTLNFSDKQTITGDLATVPNGVLWFQVSKSNPILTWSSTSRTNILAMENVRCSNIDKLLNDMSALEAKLIGNEVWYKTISLIGTRTSASDAAVQTLQSKGYTVSITPA